MSERSPGFEDYIPSRLEWFSLLLNSYMSYIDAQIGLGVKIDRLYMPKSDGKTLVLFVSYPKDLDSKIVENTIDKTIENTKRMIEIYEWDSWVEIEVKRQPI